MLGSVRVVLVGTKRGSPLKLVTVLAKPEVPVCVLNEAGAQAAGIPMSMEVGMRLVTVDVVSVPETVNCVVVSITWVMGTWT